MPTTDQAMLNEVHLWPHWIDDQAGLGEHLDLLDDDERARAGRFRFERDRTRFIVRRALRRRILAGYIGVRPASIRFRTSSKGRPEIEPPCEVTFSTSHSDALAIVAVAFQRLVGVDIERVRPIPDPLDLADRLFSRRESDYLRSVPEPSRSEALLALWTRKESYVKAVGAGLSLPLDGFEMLTDDDGPVGRPRGPQGDLPFTYASLDGPPGYVGAVTVSGTEIVTRQMTVTASIS